MNTSLGSKISLLKVRAHFLYKVRAFFYQRAVLEVDCPALSLTAPIDRHIDVMKVDVGLGKSGYLHTSPEYGMKRLLSCGIGDIYQMSHVFRQEEVGPLHNPEFMMIEWYRVGFSFEALIQETLELLSLFLGTLRCTTMTYRTALLHFLNIDYVACSVKDLVALAHTHQLGLPQEALLWDKDTLLQLLMSALVEPQLGVGEVFVLTHFPAMQAALSKVERKEKGEEVGLRFEIYAQGIELANGYEELTDAAEQEKRLKEANALRIHAGKESLPLDEHFLEALRVGLPACCGVAVGFDRLLQLHLNLNSIHPVLPLQYE